MQRVTTGWDLEGRIGSCSWDLQNNHVHKAISLTTLTCTSCHQHMSTNIVDVIVVSHIRMQLLEMHNAMMLQGIKYTYTHVPSIHYIIAYDV